MERETGESLPEGGTWPMARLLTDPAVEEWIQETARSASPMSQDQAATLSRLLRFGR